MELNKIYQGHSLQVLQTFTDSFVNTVITSLPYWGLKDYGIDGQIGLEKTVQEYVDQLLNVFR